MISGAVVWTSWGDWRVQWRAGIDFKGSRRRFERVLWAGQYDGLGRGLKMAEKAVVEMTGQFGRGLGLG